MSNETRIRLEAVFREVFDDEALQIGPGIDRESLEAWDSLGHIRLISALEEVFGVTFTIDEIEGMVSAPQILAALSSKS